MAFARIPARMVALVFLVQWDQEKTPILQVAVAALQDTTVLDAGNPPVSTICVLSWVTTVRLQAVSPVKIV